MGHDLAFRTGLAAGLGLVAAAGNLVGGYFVVRKDWPRKFLQYFLALGAGYMLAVAFVEVIPESVRLSGESALLFVLFGYFIVHLFEHTLAPHFHFGEETHCEEVSHYHARTSVLVGMTIHTFFDGVAIAAGLLGAATLLGVLLTSALEGQLKYALPLSGGVTLYVAATDLLPEVNREPNWRLALLVFAGVASLLIMQRLFHV